jgi:hypothetical protein
VVELVAGDVLYIPPLTFHHVEAIEASVSVNAWTDTEQTALVEAMFAAEMPRITSTHTSGSNQKQRASSGAGSDGAANGITQLNRTAWATLYTIASVLTRCKLTASAPLLFVEELLHHRYGAGLLQTLGGAWYASF